jgi:Tol biopolymer transport system component
MEPRPSLAKLAALLAAGVSVLVLAGSAEGSSGSNSAKGWIAVEGGGELRALNAQTGRRRRLAVFVESEAAWSRDGRKLAYVADGALRAMSFRSGKQRVITRLRGRFSTGPQWSPGGDRLAFTLHGALSDTAELVVVGHDGRRRRVVDRAASSYQVPQWSPSGRTIAYLRSSAGAAAIWVVHPDGRAQHVLEDDVLDYPNSLSWSPDGRRLAFVGRNGGGSPGVAVLLADANGTHAHAVTADTSESDLPSIGYVQWSPAGGRIAFLRWAPNGDASLCVTDLQHGERALVLSPSIDEFAWSPDGRWLAYLIRNPNSVWVVRADGSRRKRLGRLYEEAESLAWGNRSADVDHPGGPPPWVAESMLRSNRPGRAGRLRGTPACTPGAGRARRRFRSPLPCRPARTRRRARATRRETRRATAS